MHCPGRPANRCSSPATTSDTPTSPPPSVVRTGSHRLRVGPSCFSERHGCSSHRMICWLEDRFDVLLQTIGGPKSHSKASRATRDRGRSDSPKTRVPHLQGRTRTGHGRNVDGHHTRDELIEYGARSDVLLRWGSMCRNPYDREVAQPTGDGCLTSVRHRPVSLPRRRIADLPNEDAQREQSRGTA